MTPFACSITMRESRAVSSWSTFFNRRRRRRGRKKDRQPRRSELAEPDLGRDRQPRERRWRARPHLFPFERRTGSRCWNGAETTAPRNWAQASTEPTWADQEATGVAAARLTSRGLGKLSTWKQTPFRWSASVSTSRRSG